MDIDAALSKIVNWQPPHEKAATVAKTHLDDVLGNLYVDVAVDDNDDEAVGDDVFVDLKKGLNMPAVLMLTKTWMIHKFRFWRFSIPPYKLKPLKNVNSGGTPQMPGTLLLRLIQSAVSPFGEGFPPT